MQWDTLEKFQSRLRVIIPESKGCLEKVFLFAGDYGEIHFLWVEVWTEISLVIDEPDQFNINALEEAKYR